MPLDTIERAIKRGTGELEGVTYESITYEGYAPNGVAVYVDALTDNRNRTGAEIRSTFSKLGGSLAEPGAVAWQFERKGIVLIPGSVDEEELMMAALEAGADDITLDGDLWQVVCEPHDTSAVAPRSRRRASRSTRSTSRCFPRRPSHSSRPRPPSRSSA